MATASAATKKFESELKDLQRPTMELKHVGETADDVSHDLDQLAATSVVAGRRIDDIGDEAVGAAAKLGILGHELDSVDRKAGSLGGSGVKAAKSGLEALGGLGSNLRGALIPVAVGLGVALAPTIGAAIAGAVVGGVGLGGIAGGIAMAARDPRVKAAGADFASHAGAIFDIGGRAFVQPTIDSLHILQQGLDNLHLGDALAPLAKILPDVARGVANFGTEAMPGLNRAITAAGPALKLISDELPKIGAAFGDMVGDIASSKGAMDGLRFILSATEKSLGSLGVLVSGLSSIFHGFAAAGAEVSGAMEDISVGPAHEFFAVMNNDLEDILGTAPKVSAAWAPIPGRLAVGTRAWADALTAQASAAAVSAAATQALTASFQNAIGAADGLITVWDELHGRTLSADESLLAAKKAVDTLAESFKRNGGAIKGNSEAALENRINMAKAGEAASVAAQKYFDATGDIDGARKIMRDQQKAAEDAAVANGGNARAVHDLAGEMFKMPKSVKATITVAGTQTAKNAVDALIRSINNVQSKTVYVRTIATSGGAIASARAAGGPVEPGVPYRINERGMETVTFPAYGQVHPASLSPARAYSGGGSSGGSSAAQRLASITVTGSALMKTLMAELQREIRTNYGGVVAALG
jgi:hypothetical protein